MLGSFLVIGPPKTPLTLLAIAAAGTARGAVAARPNQAVWLADHPRGLRGPWRARGHLLSDPQGSGPNASVDLLAQQLMVDGEWEPVHLRIRTTVYERPSRGWVSGDRFEAFLPLRAVRPAANPGIPPRDQARAAGFDLRAGLKSFRQLRRRGRPPPWSPSRLGSQLRRWVRTEIERRFEARAAIVSALLLGERGDIDNRDSTLLARTGLGHLLAISGLHLSLVLGACFLTVRALGSSRRMAAAVCLVALLPLTFIVVSRASVRRASIMAAVLSASAACGRKGLPLNALAVTVILLTARDPWAMHDLGFRLSAAATISILLLATPGTGTNAGRPAEGSLAAAPTRWMSRLLSASCAAQLGVAPFIAASTFRLPLVGLVLNLAAVPLLAMTLMACLATVALGLLGADLTANLGASVATRGIDAIIAVAAAGDSVSNGLVVGTEKQGALLAAWTGLTLALLLGRRTSGTHHASLPRRTFAAGAAAVAACGLFLLLRPARQPERFEVIALDVGQGDALLLGAPGTGPVLVDTGGSFGSRFDPGAAIVAPALRARGIRRLDAVLLSHLHADHVGGLPGLASELPVREIWTGSYPPEAPQARALDAIPGRVLALGAGHRRLVGGCEWSVLHPSESWLRAGGTPVANNASLVLTIRCADRTLLLTGDVERPAELPWALPELLAGHLVLKSPHHGSATSSRAELLDAASPRHAVISAGWRNRFGLPDAAVLDRYRRRQIAVYRTDRDGAITITLGRRIAVRAERWTAGRGRLTTGGWLH